MGESSIWNTFSDSDQQERSVFSISSDSWWVGVFHQYNDQLLKPVRCALCSLFLSVFYELCGTSCGGKNSSHNFCPWSGHGWKWKKERFIRFNTLSKCRSDRNSTEGDLNFRFFCSMQQPVLRDNMRRNQ